MCDQKVIVFMKEKNNSPWSKKRVALQLYVIKEEIQLMQWEIYLKCQIKLIIRKCHLKLYLRRILSMQHSNYQKIEKLSGFIFSLIHHVDLVIIFETVCLTWSHYTVSYILDRSLFIKCDWHSFFFLGKVWCIKNNMF